ncbi:MAG: hypothetical protein KAG92_04650 [Deltaproteobacteria bacterium]|nr:hypothetical protein [Deltaproteobacteria bacterium]
MSRKILLLSVIMAFMISGCGWHVPFFGSKEVQEEEPLVQEATQVDEMPQYSGQEQSPDPTLSAQQYQQPGASANQYNQAPAYGQPPQAPYGQNPQAAGAFQPGQPYNPNTNYALNASPGYGGQPGMPAAYGTAGGTGANFNSGVAQSNLGGGASQFGTPPSDGLDFSGIKRKALYIISYPQRGLTTTPQDAFSQKIYQHLTQAPGINLVPKEAIERYNDAHVSFSQSLDIQSHLSKMGQALGAQAIILEKVRFTSNFGSGAYAAPSQQVEMQLIDTATGYAVKSYNLDPATPGAGQVINSLTNHVRMIDWSARVIKAEKKRILINAGRLSGIQAGQNLRVYAKGSEIKDPQSKLSLGQAQGALKGTVKVIDFFGLDGAICEPLTAGKFKLGDMVKAVE